MRLFLVFALLGVQLNAYAQLKLSGKLSPTVKTLTFYVPFDGWVYRADSQKVSLDAQGNFSVQLPVTTPQIIFMDYADQRLYLYAEPGKTLVMRADRSDIRFGGSLGKENQFRQRLGLTYNRLGQTTYNDSLSSPATILAELQQSQNWALAQLKTLAFKPTSAFLEMTKADLTYFAASKVWDLIWENGVWTSRNKSQYGQPEWRAVLKQVYQAVNLSDATALRSYPYQQVIAYYSRYLQHQCASKEAFATLAEEMFRKPFAAVNQEIREKGERYWEYKAINYGLSGPSLERAIASFLTQGIKHGELGYQREAYEDFMHRFPKSSYRTYVQQLMKPYWDRVSQAERSDIHVHPASIPTLDSLLAAHRGKVVYLDLWGSWCGPCREEFTFNQALKEQFKGQAVDFLYVAVEHTTNPEKGWRETIAFYQLTGYHILAGKALVDDVQRHYSPQSHLQFPSYILVDKSGKIVTVHAKRPSEKEALYEQIRQLL
ncbi:TlpA family protein disulfide reductase [Siphonobacter sp.]|uniref:TlpA family protein disulfide reductase n=1 Tax=Siphonobacter sp. TaxID=1869184 RepID=UPI003B3ACBDF